MFSKLNQYITEKRKEKDVNMVRIASTFLGELQRNFKDNYTDIEASKVATKLLKTMQDNVKKTKGTFIIDPKEQEFLEFYILPQMTTDEMYNIVHYMFNIEGIDTKGKLMKEFKKCYEGQYDGKELSSTIDDSLEDLLK